MKQLLILSGKGGTGKTTVATSFIKLSAARAYADCDVEAPNLHLLLSYGKQPQQRPFMGMPKAHVNATACCGCGVCHDNCRFNAPRRQGSVYEIDSEVCEGCGLCALLCPSKAIKMKSEAIGNLLLYQDEDRTFSTAYLKIGAGTSGQLVAAVKEQLKECASDVSLSVIDGPPGIGCPVIASLASVDAVLLITEPTLSGQRDLERVLETVGMVGCRTLACVNRFDLDLEGTLRVEEYCRQHGVICVGRIPYDRNVVDAVNQGLSIVDVECLAGDAVEAVFAKTMKQMGMVLPAKVAPDDKKE